MDEQLDARRRVDARRREGARRRVGTGRPPAAPPSAGYPTAARTAAAVFSSAGKNDSIESSLAVTSTAVPKVATVPMKDRSPASLRRRSGTAISGPPR